MALNQSKSLEIATTETLDFILYTTYTPLMKITYRNKITKPLTLEQQVSLTTDYNSGMSNKDLEKKYQITKQTIYNVLRSLPEICSHSPNIAGAILSIKNG